MAFSYAAFSYIVALIIDAFLIFFAIFHVSSSWAYITLTGCYLICLYGGKLILPVNWD